MRPEDGVMDSATTITITVLSTRHLRRCGCLTLPSRPRRSSRSHLTISAKAQFCLVAAMFWVDAVICHDYR
jgi:hypothetical protein